MRARCHFQVALALAIAGCGRPPSEPTQSTQPTGLVLFPSDGAALLSATQPVSVRFPNLPGQTQYRIEVATDRQFSNVVDDKTVPATPGGETTAQLDILKDATSYFWRVTGDNGQRVGSSTPSFSIGPAVLPGPYKLQVGVTSTSDCKGEYAAFLAAQWLPVEMQHDLQVSQDTLTFAIDGPLPYRPPLVLKLTRDDHGVSGTMLGGSPDFAPISEGMFIFVSAGSVFPDAPAVAVGHVTYDGRITGTLSGRLAFGVILYSGAAGVCGPASLPWALIPVR